jgi:hypothetical protein
MYPLQSIIHSIAMQHNSLMCEDMQRFLHINVSHCTTTLAHVHACSAPSRQPCISSATHTIARDTIALATIADDTIPCDTIDLDIISEMGTPEGQIARRGAPP